MVSTEELLRFYLPYLIQAGDYALRIQSRVRSQPAKLSKNSNLISEALTDADLSVQNFFELVTIACYPQIRIVGEETEHSLNLKYFPNDTHTTVVLDPINGTKLYKDISGEFDIILTILRETRVVGSVTYIPQIREFFLATESGAFRTTASEVGKGALWKEFDLQKAAEVIVTYRADRKEADALRREFTTVVELDNDYDPQKRNFAIHDILTGRTVACLRKNAYVGDWGAIGFIVEKAGGVFTDFEGRTISDQMRETDFRFPSVIFAADAALATRLRSIISSANSLGTKT